MYPQGLMGPKLEILQNKVYLSVRLGAFCRMQPGWEFREGAGKEMKRLCVFRLEDSAKDWI